MLRIALSCGSIINKLVILSILRKLSCGKCLAQQKGKFHTDPAMIGRSDSNEVRAIMSEINVRLSVRSYIYISQVVEKKPVVLRRCCASSREKIPLFFARGSSSTGNDDHAASRVGAGVIIIVVYLKSSREA